MRAEICFHFQTDDHLGIFFIMKRSATTDEDAKKNRKLEAENDSLSLFQMRDIQRFDLNFPFFREPNEIGSFSVDIQRNFVHDKSQLKYYIKPPTPAKVHFDLKMGYKEMIRKDENKKDYIDHILQWILLNNKKFALQIPDNANKVTKDVDNRQLHTDFICWRGLLTKLACTPYETRDGWLMAVTLYNGTYYLCEFDTAEKLRENESMTPGSRQDEMCCWGWKFEQYLTADQPDSQPDLARPYNNCEGFCTVVRSRLNKHSLVFSGEVDCISTSGHGDASSLGSQHYIELKTTRELDTQKQDNNFKRYKLIKWWLQSFLVGVPEVVCGYKDDNGVVHRLEAIHTNNMPKMAKDVYQAWNSCVCFNFLDQFLTFVKQTVTVDSPRVVYLFEWSPRRDITCHKLPEDSDFTFLPDWYTGSPT